jgi:Cu(I)/Ag(I) efflux system membrane protein CusA/SilA
VEIVPTYDRSGLIERAVDNLTHKLIEEFIVVAVVCFIFLFHLRSALVAIISLPLGILAAFIVMHYQGVNANIMSLGGIAIAIGAMVDAAVVMIENAHKHLEHWQPRTPGETLEGGPLAGHRRLGGGGRAGAVLLAADHHAVLRAGVHAGSAGRTPVLAAGVHQDLRHGGGRPVGDLIPVLMGYLIRGRIPDEKNNPLNRLLIAVYRPLLDRVLRAPKLTLVVALVVLATSLWPLRTSAASSCRRWTKATCCTCPRRCRAVGRQGGRAAAADRSLIKTVPEVASVFGKAGRAESATDPAPLEMFETTIQFKPRDQWRAGMTTDKLVEELDRIVKVPGLSNIWVPPIRNRIDMLATGIKSPVGVKVAGTDLATIDRITGEIERAQGRARREQRPGRAAHRRALRRCDIRRDDAARYGLNIADVQSVSHPPWAARTSARRWKACSASRSTCAIRARCAIRWKSCASCPCDRARPAPGAVRRGRHPRRRRAADAAQRERAPVGLGLRRYPGRDLRSAVQDMQQAVAKQVKLPPGYSISWSGQFEFLERATAKLKVVVPFTLLIIFVLLYLTFGAFGEALLIMARCRSRWWAASGCCICWATTCRSRARWASSRWPACPPSSA